MTDDALVKNLLQKTAGPYDEKSREPDLFIVRPAIRRILDRQREFI